MKIGDTVRVTSGRLGGYDNQAATGRPDKTVEHGDIGVVVREANEIDGEWFIARFVQDDEVVFIPVVEPDHVEVTS